MIIYLKNKHTLVVDEFQFRCAIGKNGLSNKKIEGDFCTLKGIFLNSPVEKSAEVSKRYNPPAAPTHILPSVSLVILYTLLLLGSFALSVLYR